MSTSEVRSDDATAARVDMKFEIVVIPVSDVDRAKEFYGRLGWRLDADYDNGNDFRVIQFTPPGSGCSVIFGKNVTGGGTRLRPGPVPDRLRHRGCARRTRRARRRRERGVPRRRRRVRWHGPALPVWAAPGQRSGSRASQLPLVRLLQRSRRQRLAAAGDQGAAPGPGCDVDVAALAQLLHETAEHHGSFEAVAPQHDWWDWYASYMDARERGRTPEEASAAAGRYMADVKHVVVSPA